MVKNIKQEERDLVEPIIGKLTDYIIMSVTYKGEPFSAICRVREIDEEHIKVKPIALILDEEKLEDIKDPLGQSPRVVQIVD